MPSAKVMPALARDPLMGNHEVFQHLTFRAGAPRPRGAEPSPPSGSTRSNSSGPIAPTGRRSFGSPRAPTMAIPRKSRGQRRVDLIVERTNREHPRTPLFLGRIVRHGQRRSLGVEELMGVA